MSEQIFFLDAAKASLTELPRTAFKTLSMKEADIEGLLAKRSGALFGRDVLWIGRQTWASDNQRSDLIGLDDYGSLVVAELKRGEAGPDSLTQALGYAAHLASLEIEDLARMWAETGSKASGLVHKSPESADAALTLLQKRADESGDLNSDQLIVIAAESFDPRLLNSCDYLSEVLKDAPRLTVECWEYRVHALGATPGFVVTLRQVVPSRTVRDEIATRQELRGEKGWKRRNRFTTALHRYLINELSASGWKFARDGKWYAFGVADASWSSAQAGSIEFGDGAEPVLYLPPGKTIVAPTDGVVAVDDWSDDTGAVWKRFKFPFASEAAPFAETQGEIVVRALKSISTTPGQSA